MIYIDIDGTLTDKGESGGNPIIERIDKVKKLISKGRQVIIWSGGGLQYAQKFCAENDLFPYAALGKPTILIDDNPTIRPIKKIKYFTPNQFIKENF